MGLHGYDPNIKAVTNAELGRHNRPSDDYDPNSPRRRHFVLSPLGVVGIALVLALVGLFFLLR